jgi:hypothetical protein
MLSMPESRRRLPSLVDKEPPAWQRAAIALCAAVTGTLGLWELLYGVWATSWNVGHGSFVGAAVTSAVTVATPVTMIVTWRSAKAVGASRWMAMARSSFFGALVSLVVAMFLAVAAAGTG